MTASGDARSTRPNPCRLKSLHNFAALFTASPLATMRALNIWSPNPAHSRAPPVAAGDGAGCGACAFVPCKHGARAARGSALVHNDTTRSVRYRVRATPSVNAGNAPSNGSATPQAVQRRAERRRAPRSLRQGQGGRARRKACTGYPSANRRSAPSACRRDKNPPARRETRRPAVGPSYAADDFAWLFDK